MMPQCRWIFLIAVTMAIMPWSKGESFSGQEAPSTWSESVARLINPEYRSLLDRHRELEAALLKLPWAPSNERTARVGWKVFGYGNALPSEQWIEIDLGSLQPIDSVCLVPIDLPSANSIEPGVGFPRRFRVELVNPTPGKTVVVDFSQRDFPNPGAYPVLIATPHASARRVRVVMTKPWEKGHYRSYALGEIMILHGNRNLVTGLAGTKVKTSGSFELGPTWSRDHLIDGQSIVGAPITKSGRPRTDGWESGTYADAATPVWAQVDLGRSTRLDEIRLLPVKSVDFSNVQGYGFPAHFKVEIANDAEFADATIVADWSVQPFNNFSFSPVTIPCGSVFGRYIRVTARELWARQEGQFLFALGEVQAYAGDTNVALGAKVTTSNETRASNHFRSEFLTDGQRALMRLTEWPLWLGQLSLHREVQLALDETEHRIAELRPQMMSQVMQIAVFAAILAAFAMLATLVHIRRKQARTVAALQRRIAGDLHDEIGSNLATIAMIAELGPGESTGPRSADSEVIRKLAADSASAMRDIVWLTQPGPHDAMQLTERLQEAAERMLKEVKWTFEIAGLKEAPSLDVQRHLLLALKEMLNNVLRHSGASQVTIRLAVTNRNFTLTVEDDGRGFVADQRGSGHGLTSLRHRSTLLCGKLELASEPGRGTRILFSGLLHPPAQAPLATP